MAAYVVADVEIRDREKYDEYRSQVPSSIEAFGGKFLVRGGQTEMLEGTWNPKRFVILEFESLEKAKEWWNSEIYRAPKELRQSASITNMIVTEGVEAPVRR